MGNGRSRKIERSLCLIKNGLNHRGIIHIRLIVYGGRCSNHIPSGIMKGFGELIDERRINQRLIALHINNMIGLNIL